MKLFYSASFKHMTEVNQFTGEELPNVFMNNATTGLVDRLKARVCEMCGSTDDLEMHHVRKLKDVAHKQPWEILMYARMRKTMAVCNTCQKRIHGGVKD